MEPIQPDQIFLDYIIKAIVNHPEDVVITRSVDQMGVLLTLTVHPEDMGKVIGKGGKLATLAIRPLLHVFGMKHNARISLVIKEPIASKKSPVQASESERKTVDEVVDGF